MSRKLPPKFELNIERLSRNGEGVGFLGGKEINIFGVFPGEKVLASPITRKKKVWKAELIEVLKASSERRKQKESHYVSCGPWQTLNEITQLSYKKELVTSAFIKELSLDLPNPEIVESDKKFFYRNKMEFSFTEDEAGLKIALHKRYRYRKFSKLDSCVLAEKKINSVAQAVLSELKKNKIKLKQLKNLLVRYSIYEDKCLVSLFVVDENIKIFEINNNDIVGWHIIYSDPLSPATLSTKFLHKKGNDLLTEKISDVYLKYFYDSFFQINPRSFEKIISYLKDNIDSNHTLVDLYSGVGTIGLCLHENFKEIHSVEFDKKSSEICIKNSQINNIDNVNVYSGEAEKQELNKILKKEDTLIVDPPRSGMHPKALKQILDICPKNLIYVSCNPFTQLNDMKALEGKYRIRKWRLFDMYPQTPHIESVLMLVKK